MEKYVAEVRYQSHIPNDIAFSILLKLSIKSLKRFGCVCKSWSLLFHDPIFMTAYRKILLSNDHSYYNDKSLFLHQTILSSFEGHYSENTYKLYSVSDDRLENRVQLNWPKVTLDQYPDYDSGFDILGPGSVNGTLCLICANMENMILWNPFTEEFKVIPPSSFDSGVWVNHRGFGYDSVGNDFKVLCHLQLFQNSNCDNDMMPEKDISFNSIWEIYSVRNNSWKKLDVDMDHNQMEYEELYIDGLSHWLCKTESDSKTCLLSFDWSNEVFLTTPLPLNVEGIFSFSVKSHLVLLNGSIVLIISYEETNTFDILILGEFGVRKSWTKIFNVGPLPSFQWLIGGGKKGRLLFEKKDHRLAWFDLNCQMIEDLDIFAERFCFKILFHKENLLPIPFEGKSI